MPTRANVLDRCVHDARTGVAGWLLRKLANLPPAAGMPRASSALSLSRLLAFVRWPRLFRVAAQRARVVCRASDKAAGSSVWSRITQAIDLACRKYALSKNTNLIESDCKKHSICGICRIRAACS